MVQQAKAGTALECRDVPSIPRLEVVDAGHRVAAVEERSAEMRPDESGAAGNNRVQEMSPSGKRLASREAGEL
jgi:hypothetical protein